MGSGWPLEVMRAILELDTGSGGWHDPVKVLKAIELYTLKWLILCYTNFLSIKTKFKINNKS